MSVKLIGYYSSVLIVLALVLAFTPNPATGNTITVATFSDPALNAGAPLFMITFGASGSVTGGWDDSQTGLDLEVPITGDPTYQDAFFTMTPLTYNGNASGGATGPGTIKFFADGVDPGTAEPLVMYSFDSAQLSPVGLYADDLFHTNNVQITVKGYSQVLTDEQFSFAFANKTMVGGVNPTGFTATAAFTSSAIPEPATVILLGLGSLVLIRSRSRRIL